MSAQIQTEFLTHFPMFSVLTQEELMQLGQMLELRSRQRFGLVYQAGEPSNYLYFLRKGGVKICTYHSDGREIIKNILQPYAMFGELGVVGEDARQDYAKALNEEIQYFALRVEDFHRLMRNNHQLTLRMLSLVGSRLVTAERRLESLVFKDARSRIIDFLKDTVEKTGRRIGFEMLIKHSLTQQDIANLTGTSRQTVTSVLNELRKSDKIYFNRRSILIRDVAALA